jgi:hypothetical protein
MKRTLRVLADIRIVTAEVGGTVCLAFLIIFGMYAAWRDFIWPLFR